MIHIENKLDGCGSFLCDFFLLNVLCLLHHLFSSYFKYKAKISREIFKYLSSCFSLSYINLQTGANFERNLKPVIHLEIVEAQKEEVRKVVLTEYMKPRECITEYEKYSNLVSGEAEEDVKKFLSQPYTFQAILAEIVHYQKLAEQIQYTSAEVKCVITAYFYKVRLNHATGSNCRFPWWRIK